MPYLYIKSCELNDMLFLQTTIIPNKGSHNFQHSTLYSRFFIRYQKQSGQHSDLSTIGFAISFVLMMVLNVLME